MVDIDEFRRLPWFHSLVPVSDHPNDPGYRKRNCELLLYGSHLFEMRHLIDSNVERGTAIYRETLCYIDREFVGKADNVAGNMRLLYAAWCEKET